MNMELKNWGNLPASIKSLDGNITLNGISYPIKSDYNNVTIFPQSSIPLIGSALLQRNFTGENITHEIKIEYLKVGSKKEYIINVKKLTNLKDGRTYILEKIST